MTGWRVAGAAITHAVATGEDFAADEFVLAGGTWSADVIRPLELRLPLQPGKGYSLTLPTPRQLPQLCSLLAEARVAVTPMGTSLRVGGTMELGDSTPTIRRQRVEAITTAFPKYFPEFIREDFVGVPVWSGLRPCSPDGLPYIGRFSRYPNLIAATGHAMGLSLGPITGQMVTDLVSQKRPPFAMHLLSPDRF